jgi:L-cysteate sulfo-lyase
VDCGAVVSPEHTVAQLVGSLSASHDAPPLRIRHDQVGTGYATPGDTVFDAMLTAARHEGVVLDPIYTGRAMAGLIAAADDGQLRAGQRTVFVHTGGMPGLFGHPATLARAEREVRDASTTASAG